MLDMQKVEDHDVHDTASGQACAMFDEIAGLQSNILETQSFTFLVHERDEIGFVTTQPGSWVHSRYDAC